MESAANSPGRIEATQDCPQCGASLPIYTGYITWCDNCSWNLHPEEADPPSNLLDSMYASLNQRLSHGLFKKLVSAPSLKPSPTRSTVIAYVIAGLVHGLTLTVAVLGVLLTFFSWPYLIQVVIGVIFLGVAWVLVPKPPKLGKEAIVVSREESPTLYALVDRVTEALDAPKTDTIVVEESYNAAFSQHGWGRKTVLFIGLPYFSILTSQERVALIGHELGHSVNGDIARGFFVGTAIHALATWHAILRPDYLGSDAYGDAYADTGCAVVFANVVMRGLAWPVLGTVHALAQLSWRDSQRAEYLADALAASAGSTDAQLSTLEKSYFRHSFEVAAQRASTYFKDENLFDDLRARVRSAPQREMERIRRMMKLPTSDLATSHPPTAFRLEMLHAHPVAAPKVVLGEIESQQLDRELSQFEARLQEKIVQRYEEAVY